MAKTNPLGLFIPTILLPRPGIDLTRWAVIACDQFTSQPEYWQSVQAFVGDSPSTYHLILPEVFLGQPEETRRIQSTWRSMQTYLDQGLFQSLDGPFYVERTAGQKTRRGLVLCMDLEQYDFTPGSQSLIRATEGTILDRLPPRIRIRESAPLELPHILVLIDDPADTVLGPVAAQKNNLKTLYDFDLMLDSGHLHGYQANQRELVDGLQDALGRLADPQAFQARYGAGADKGSLLFAVGDGNHSLATAKSIWETIKDRVGPDHPARYALVEVENVHDAGLEFTPIHRVLFNLKTDLRAFLQAELGSRLDYAPCRTTAEMIDTVDHATGPAQSVGYLDAHGPGILTFKEPSSQLPVGTLQAFLDSFIKKQSAQSIDYVHGLEPLIELSGRPGNTGFYLPAMAKSDLFKTVIQDGVLPRKTFSMGEAKEKRFYMECRRIV